KKIEAIIHPQSVIHSIVEYIDGSHLAQLSYLDMKIPILYALSYPERYPSELVKTDLYQYPELNFAAIEPERYPLYYLGLEAAKAGGILPTVINAAVEAAIQLFLSEKISFPELSQRVKKTLDKAEQISKPNLDEILWANKYYYDTCLKGL
ncbi:MAG: 1-deoxy-D-xylulose-5-phosphate reductoisomerase, partial [Candidatus Cloacimonetes bacterium]|nr:1-deoxy-D-xylulose-5-phosphate reductoisomerase [Candidatus Cloacimonadota bacterium]